MQHDSPKVHSTLTAQPGRPPRPRCLASFLPHTRPSCYLPVESSGQLDLGSCPQERPPNSSSGDHSQPQKSLFWFCPLHDETRVQNLRGGRAEEIGVTRDLPAILGKGAVMGNRGATLRTKCLSPVCGLLLMQRVTSQAIYWPRVKNKTKDVVLQTLRTLE